MKIAVWHNLPSGGGKRALFNHVRGLLERGHVVESWCPPTADQTYLPLSGILPEHVVDLQWPVSPSRKDFWQITLHAERSLAAMEAHCRECAIQIDAGRFDVLFANSCMFFRSTPIGRLSETPSVLYLQEPYRWLYEALPTLCWLAPQPRDGAWWSVKNVRAAFSDIRTLRNNRVQAREEVRNAEAFGSLLVNSYFSRESVLRAYGLDSTVCYLGIDIPEQALSPENREDFIVGLGALTPEKNVSFCIEAMSYLAPPRPKLVWVCNFVPESYFDQMKRLATRLGVEFEARVRISDEDLLHMMGRATAMVYAPRLEPFGLAPLEANACGLPVIAVAEGGVRETIIDGLNGILVEHSPVAMGAALDRLRADPLLAKRMGHSAREYVAERWGQASAAGRIEAELKRYARGRA